MCVQQHCKLTAADAVVFCTYGRFPSSLTPSYSLVPTSLVHHIWYYLPPSSITNPRTLFLAFHNLFPCIRPSNVIFSNESCLRIWPNHLFCRLLFLRLPFAILLHLFCAQSTILSSYASISTFQMPQVAEYPLFVKSTFYSHTTQHSRQILSPYVFVYEGWEISAWDPFSYWRLLFPIQFSFLLHDNYTVFSHQTSEVTKLFHFFQVLSINFDLMCISPVIFLIFL